MADIPIAPFSRDDEGDSDFIQNPERGTPSANLAAGGVSVTTDDTLIINCEFNNDIEIFATGAGDVTVEAGDYPPSVHSAQGDVTYTNAGTTRFIPEADRHMKADGTIHVTVGATLTFWVLRNPGGYVGVTHSNRREVPAAPGPVGA